jgi:hypothetical protein
MARKYPPEFKWDLVTVAGRGDLSVAQVAIDFGVAERRACRLCSHWIEHINIRRRCQRRVGKLTPVALFGLNFTEAPIRQPPDRHNQCQLNRQQSPEGLHA